LKRKETEKRHAEKEKLEDSKIGARLSSCALIRGTTNTEGKREGGGEEKRRGAKKDKQGGKGGIWEREETSSKQKKAAKKVGNIEGNVTWQRQD